MIQGYILLAISCSVMIINVIEMYKVNKKQKKLDKCNVTGYATEFLSLGYLIPINLGMACINILYIIFA